MGFIVHRSEHVLSASLFPKRSAFINSSSALELVSIHILIQFVECVYSERN